MYALAAFITNVTLTYDPALAPTVSGGGPGGATVNSSAVFEGCYSGLDAVTNLLGGLFIEGSAKAVLKYAKAAEKDPVAH